MQQHGIGDLSEWDVSNVTNMSSMFRSSGHESSSWKVGNLSAWNVSNVKNMSYMFYEAGYSAEYELDLSGWQVPLVTNYGRFNYKVESKIVSPVWVN